MGARSRWVLVLLLACSPPPPRPAPSPPVAPVLEEGVSPSFVMRWTLRGSAPGGTQVRIHLDDACLGPVWRDVTPEQLQAGLEVDLAGGTVNVFTALAVDAAGLASDCSAPVKMRYVRPLPPQRPDVTIRPAPPSRETHFTLTGAAVDATSVRLFRGDNCVGEPHETISAEDYARLGFGVDVTENGSLVVSLDSLNVVGQHSSCASQQWIVNDRTPPRVEARLRSPTPSPSPFALVSVSREASEGWVFDGPGCGGGMLALCLGPDCAAVPVLFQPGTGEWSAQATDALGNRSDCVDSQEPWRVDPMVPEPAVVLEVSDAPYSPGNALRALVPASSTVVRLFDGPDCDGQAQRASIAARHLAGEGIYLPTYFGAADGGLMSGRGIDATSSELACSLPVTRRW